MLAMRFTTGVPGCFQANRLNCLVCTVFGRSCPTLIRTILERSLNAIFYDIVPSACVIANWKHNKARPIMRSFQDVGYGSGETISIRTCKSKLAVACSCNLCHHFFDNNRNRGRHHRGSECPHQKVHRRLAQYEAMPSAHCKAR